MLLTYVDEDKRHDTDAQRRMSNSGRRKLRQQQQQQHVLTFCFMRTTTLSTRVSVNWLVILKVGFKKST